MCTFLMHIYFTGLQISIVLLKIIGDHKRKNGRFEYGCRFYTAGTGNKNTYREGDKWWLYKKLTSPAA